MVQRHNEWVTIVGVISWSSLTLIYIQDVFIIPKQNSVCKGAHIKRILLLITERKSLDIIQIEQF